MRARTASGPVTGVLRRVFDGYFGSVRKACGAPAADEEAIHRYRVGLRRARYVHLAFASVLDRTWLAPRHAARLRACIAETGAGRDAQVQVAWLNARIARRGDGPLRRGLARAVAAIAAAAPDTLPGAAAMERMGRRVRRIARKIDRRLADGERRGSAPAVGAVLATLLPREIARFDARCERGLEDGGTAALHRARLAAKRLRYVLEAMRAMGVRGTGRAVRRLVRFQDQFGRVNDAAVLCERVRACAGDAAAAWARAACAVADESAGDRGRDAVDAQRLAVQEWIAAARWIATVRDRAARAAIRHWSGPGRAALRADLDALAARVAAPIAAPIVPPIVAPIEAPVEGAIAIDRRAETAPGADPVADAPAAATDGSGAGACRRDGGDRPGGGDRRPGTGHGAASGMAPEASASSGGDPPWTQTWPMSVAPSSMRSAGERSD